QVSVELRVIVYRFISVKADHIASIPLNSVLKIFSIHQDIHPFTPHAGGVFGNRSLSSPNRIIIDRTSIKVPSVFYVIIHRSLNRTSTDSEIKPKIQGTDLFPPQ